MNKALNKYEKNVTYLEQEGGDHYLSNEEDRVEYFRTLTDFLREHLSPDSGQT